ncbi:hypothetical protein O181_003502 [Austropuccinia psidii MF-1]|uniref:Uncharacterized protein n=1 Tax=Austropuccinia psidii MF-1 TaxID=1389203 RepID=A0A9Q3BEX8_9BASI|nr:hypothetical protein [Austropuccinia psidii MF-1]
MSSKLTSICDSNHSDSLPSVLYGAGVFDSLRDLSEESIAPADNCDISKTYDGFEYARVIEPPCINCQKKGVPFVESATSRSKRCQFCNLGKRYFSRANHRFPDNPRRLWSSIKKGAIFGLEAPVDEPPTSDSAPCHSDSTGFRMRVVQQWTNTSSSWANTGGPIPPPKAPHWSSPRSSYFGNQKGWETWKIEKKFGGSR